MAIAGLVASIFRQTTAAPTAFNAEATTETVAYSDVAYTRYQINNAAYRYWDKTQAVTVQVNAAAPAGTYHIEYLGGFVVFDAPLTAADAVTVSGHALTVAEAGGMFGWKLDLDVDLTDTTTFADNGWKTYLPSLKGAAGSCDAYWWNDETDAQYVSQGNDVVLVLYIDKSNTKERWETWAKFKKEGLSSAVKDVVKAQIDFESTGQVFYRKG